MENNSTLRNLSRCDRAPTTEDHFEWMTEGLLIFVVGIVGIVGNFISIYTFSRQKIHRIFHNLLLFLALFDVVSIPLTTFHLVPLNN
jgi:uncharacterized membrane protein